ncbi:MAG: Fe-S cluster assembly protein SufD, partial [Pirellulaceae bacterium]
MTQTTSQIEFTDQGFEDFLQSRSESQWLTELRRAAWQTFTNGHWPTQREEEWMRTDIRMFHLDKYSLAGETNRPLPHAVLSAGVDLAGYCHSMDGVPQGAQLDPDLAERGVLFG